MGKSAAKGSKRLEKVSQLTQLEGQRREEIYQSRFEAKKPHVHLSAGQTVRCEDKGKVYDAVIKEVDSSKRILRVKVHFPGWNPRYDQWLPTDSPRLRLGEYKGLGLRAEGLCQDSPWLRLGQDRHSPTLPMPRSYTEHTPHNAQQMPRSSVAIQVSIVVRTRWHTSVTDA